MIKEAIVLAGGLGTRLQSVIKDIPKPMADIKGEPFLKFLLNYLSSNGIERVILSVGYRHEVIEDYFGKKYKNIDLHYAIEDEPLGTGGGIMNALNYTQENLVYLINGDTFFNIKLQELFDFHIQSQADFSLALKPMLQFNRYGTVELDKARIFKFNEKEYKEEGLINGGIYILNKYLLETHNFPAKFSFEKDFLEKYLNLFFINGCVFDNYFIDIGVPEDYQKAQYQL